MKEQNTVKQDTLATNQDEKVSSSFDDMGLKEDLLRGIYSYGFEKPSKIQEKVIIPIIRGKNIIAQSQSGTGKTGAFGISILERIDTLLNNSSNNSSINSPSNNAPEALILAPTRELVDQIVKVIGELGAYLNVRVEKFIGGIPLKEDIVKLTNGVDIIVGTPGRVEDLLSKNLINLDNLKIFILDEVDEMFSQGFIEQVNKIFIQLDESVQIGLFSATLTDDVKELADKIMGEPIKIYIPLNEITLDGIQQYYVKLDDKQKLSVIKDLYNNLVLGTSIIFCNNIKSVDWLTQQLIFDDFPVISIHGGMSQYERDEKLKLFRNGQARIIVSTDVLSRGINAQQLSLVINFDLPFEPETYIHRIGRCGRFGRKGLAINLIGPNDETKLNFIKTHYKTIINELPANLNKLI